jgi:hypothetical protein
MADLTGMLQAAAGAAGGENLYIEDVFSTYLYTGTGAAQTITNGIDLDGEGGLVWIKNREEADSHILTDTERGATEILSSNSDAAEATDADTLTAFNSDGFALGADVKVNTSTEDYVSWTFRKAEKFFDVVTYTGTGANRTVSHNLGSVPGCIMVKRTDTTGAWQVYHRANTANPETDYLVLNTTAATADSDTRWNDTLPTDSVFTVGTEATVNASGGTYVAYLFAHDDGGFGDDGLQNVVTCGSYTGTGSTNAFEINLGYEPQWLLLRNANDTAQWRLLDNMRGWGVQFRDGLWANNSKAEDATDQNGLAITPTGFKVATNNGQINENADTIIYIAIRRGPMKTPTAGTEVFTPQTRSGTGSAATVTGAGFPPDTALLAALNGILQNTVANFNRLIGPFKHLVTSTASQDNTDSNSVSSFDMDGISFAGAGAGNSTFIGIPIPYVNYYFLRAPGFFDVVCYTGTGSATTISHNLGVVPELIIVKNRDQGDAWQVYAGDETDYLVLNTTAATADNVNRWNDTAPTASVFTIGTAVEVNTSTEKYIAYLFASVTGVSKVGTYTGNGSSVTVTTGFQPRFILVKRTDSTGNWIVGDSARGLVAGDDPYLLLNSTAAEDTDEDWVDVSATGFTVNETAANANVSTATYLYLAIS